MTDESEAELVVVRCQACGDTFTVHSGEVVVCPSCGGIDHQVAHEPLL